METQKRPLHEVSRTKHAFNDDTRDVVTTPINFPLEANTSVDPYIFFNYYFNCFLVLIRWEMEAGTF